MDTHYFIGGPRSGDVVDFAVQGSEIVVPMPVEQAGVAVAASKDPPEPVPVRHVHYHRAPDMRIGNEVIVFWVCESLGGNTLEVISRFLHTAVRRMRWARMDRVTWW